MKHKFEITLNILNRLDSKRVTLVSYFPSTMELILKQNDSTIVRLNHLIGYLEPIKHTCILYPEDLQHIKNVLKEIVENKEIPYLIAPIKGGYKIWEMGDVSYTSKPRELTEIKFYSISNKLLIRLERIKSEEIKILFRRLSPQFK